MTNSSIMEGDDSIICEEAGVNVQNIKTGNFHIKKGEEQSAILIQENVNIVGSGIEDQINSLIH